MSERKETDRVGPFRESLAAFELELSGAGVAFKRDEPLSTHTSLGVGGPADILVQPEQAAELSAVFGWARSLELPIRVLGAGSNVLVSDSGVRGVVVHTVRMKSFEIDADGSIRADAGVHFPTLVKASVSRGLRGLEGGVGIPGSLGGVVAMNAGTYDFAIGELVEKVEVVSPLHGEQWLARGEFSFRYRSSSFGRFGSFGSAGSELSVTHAVLKLSRDDPQSVKDDMNRHMAHRKRTQPVGVRSAGCIFKNPEGDSAGRLIDSLSLKGFSVGGARVSPLHANFIVHDGDATAREVMELIDSIRQRVYEQTSIELEREVMVWN